MVFSAFCVSESFNSRQVDLYNRGFSTSAFLLCNSRSFLPVPEFTIHRERDTTGENIRKEEKKTDARQVALNLPSTTQTDEAGKIETPNSYRRALRSRILHDTAKKTRHALVNTSLPYPWISEVLLPIETESTPIRHTAENNAITPLQTQTSIKQQPNPPPSPTHPPSPPPPKPHTRDSDSTPAQ
jgi:hypothetical protein